MPTRTLPAHPSLDHLKHQARDLMKARKAGDLAALQRIREFHPRFANATDSDISACAFKLSDAQLAIAREYGFASWPKLKARIEHPTATDDTRLPAQERINDQVFRRAIDLLDAGDAHGLRAHLERHPALVKQRVRLDGDNYFQNPSLLEFVAENPIRHGKLPKNIAQIATIILEAGAKQDEASVDSTLALVCSGRVPRECGVQLDLIELLCKYGADPNRAMLPAIVHGELQAVQGLLACGATLTLALAAATGKTEDARRLLQRSSSKERHYALALAAQFGHAEILRLLLDSGEDPNRYNPLGCHSHSTPLHQAAGSGHVAAVKLLVEHGARLDIKDILFHGTPLDWAKYGGQAAVVDWLQKKSRS